MNNRLKILIIFILTLLIVVGGGYTYYMMITQRIAPREAGMFNPGNVVTPEVSVGNKNTKKRLANRPKVYQSLHVKNLTDAGLPSEGTLRGMNAQPDETLPGFRGYSYRRTAKEDDYTAQNGAAGGNLMAYRSGYRNGNTQGATYSSGGTSMGSTSSLLVPRNGNYNPPTNGGIIIVDPMTDPTGQKIPAGNGIWILLILAAGYAWRKKPL